MVKKVVTDLEFKKTKKVLVPLQIYVPNGKMVKSPNDNRIQAALPTIQYILNKAEKVILFSQLRQSEKQKRQKRIKHAS